MSPRMTTDQLSKLPAWARTEFLSMEQSRATLERELRQFQGAEDSPITMRRYTSLEYYPVPDSVVRFHLGLNMYIDVRIDGGSLDINGSRLFQIQPLAANHCSIRAKDQEGAQE